jgi:predicted lipoprotein with Yx(FWY)xxD motif
MLGAGACGDSDDGGGSPYGGSTSEASETPTDAGADATAASLATGTDDELGEFLVDNDGMTLYLFTPDTTSESTCYDACATKWPPLLTDTEDVTAGDGVEAGLIGTTERTDGKMQVTYNDHPLYYYADDVEPGDTEGQGVQDIWWVVNPAGEGVTAEN